MRVLFLFLLMASGLLAEEWVTLTLKDEGEEWDIPAEAKSEAEELKDRGIHFVAPGDTKMEVLQWMQMLSYNKANGSLKLSVIERDAPSVELDGLGDELENVLRGGVREPSVSFRLIGDVLAVGVYNESNFVHMHMHMDGTGVKAFNRHVTRCIKLVPKNEQGQRLFMLNVSRTSTLRESMKALEVVKRLSDGRVMFFAQNQLTEDFYPAAWRYPGVVGDSLLDPSARIDLRLDFDAKNHRVTMFRDSGVKLRSEEQLRAYYQEKIKLLESLSTPVWLCLEGSPTLLSCFAKPFTKVAADLGIDYVVCRTARAKLTMQPIDADKYVFSINDLKLAKGARLEDRPISRALENLLDKPTEIAAMTIKLAADKYLVNGVEELPSIAHLEQRLEIYCDGAAAAEHRPYAVVHIDPDYPKAKLNKVLDLLAELDIAPLLVYVEEGSEPVEWEERERLEKMFMKARRPVIERLVSETIRPVDSDLGMLVNPLKGEQHEGEVIKLHLNVAGLKVNEGARLSLQGEKSKKILIQQIKGSRPKGDEVLAHIRVDDEVPQQDVVDVLNMLVELEVTKVTFEDSDK